MADLFSDQPAPEEGLFSSEPAPEDTGALEAMGRGALRNFPGAQQVAAAAAPYNPFSEKQTYGEEMQHLNKAADTSKAGHGVAYGLGALFGTAAPALIPGVGEAMEAAPFATNAALSAAQSQSDTNLNNFGPENAGQAALAGLIGGGVGKAASYLSRPAGEALASKAAPEAAQEVAQAAEAAPRSIGPVKEIDGMAIPYKPVAADFVPPEKRVIASQTMMGVGGMPRQWLKVFKGKDPIDETVKLNTWLNTADEGKSLVGTFDRPGELLHKIEGIHENAGKEIGRIIDAVAPTTQVPKGALIPELQEIADQSFMNDKAQKAINGLIDKINESEAAGKLDFANLQKLKGIVGKEAGSRTAEPAVKEAYGVVSKYMNDVVDEYGQRMADPRMLARYNAAKLDYKNASNLLPILNYQEARELMQGSKGGFSLRSLLGHIAQSVVSPQQIGRNIALKSAPAVGNFVQKLGAPAAGAAKAAFSPVAAAGRAISPNMGKAAQLELSNFLQSRFGKKNNEQ